MSNHECRTHHRKAWQSGAIGFLLLVAVMGLFVPFSAYANGWGQIMCAPEKTNIRSKRTIDSKLKGSLEAGRKVKADFLRENWYAVFPRNQKIRQESKALGYVYAPRLQATNAGMNTPNAQETISVDSEKSRRDATANQKLVIKDITVRMEPEGHERVFFELNRSDTPRTTIITGEKPRLAVDFKNVSPPRKGLANVEVGGEYIRRIRSSHDPQTHSLRIVLDLAADKDYSVNQTFYQSENMYVLDLTEDRNGYHPASE